MGENNTNYIDGYILPVPKKYLDQYRVVAEKVAEVWKEYGALAYFEFVADDLMLEGTRSFPEFAAAKEDEAIVFGWVEFPSREVRDLANEKVPADPRMTELVSPLVDPSRLIFDASRMVFGGFRPLVQAV